MIKNKIPVLLLTAVALLVGCDNKQKIEDNNVPFSVGGITLGERKENISPPNELIGCAPETTNTAKCYVRDQNVKYGFFGAEARQITVGLHSPYENFAEIKISLQGKEISKGQVEAKWGLKDKCLTRYEIDDSQKFDKESSGYFMRALNELSLLPSNSGEFICLASDNAFLKYNQYTDKTQGNVEIYYLQDVLANNYRYLFDAKARQKKAADEVAKAFVKPAASTQTGRCGDRYDMNAKDFHSRMEKLATESNYGASADRNFFEFLDMLCTGSLEDAKSWVTSAFIPIDSARYVAQNFRLNIEFSPPSEQAKNIVKARSDLMSIGLCTLCASEVAVFVVKKPESECGVMARKALAGDQKAVEKLIEVPKFCEWER